MYTEIRFPELGVRFIAVNDGVDSEDQMGNDFIVSALYRAGAFLFSAISFDRERDSL